ncbi:MAG TPA: PPOX class F420-dependent oxidoreductase [Solirubrobacteraceae bacterium]|nr:PPOX class F420-dependent oxidoreductase [Solirubrobacteraceae bacterium]
MTRTTTTAGELELVMPREMTREQVRSFISHGTRTAKVATVMNDGQPHVMPVWFALDGEHIVFTTAANSVKGRNLQRDPRIALVVEDDEPPFAFVHVRGRVTIHEDLDELMRFATAIGSRYMGEDRAEEFGHRNAVPGELLVRVIPERVIASADLAG